MKLSEYAKLNSITYMTAYRMYRSGKLPCKTLPTGTVVVLEEKQAIAEYVVVYSRVSSSENKPNLESQADRVTQFCNAKGWIVKEIIKECESGLNDSRPKLQAILKDKKITKVVVEHKDRLTRFGFEYIKTLFHGEIVIINEVTEDEKDLMQDFVSLVTSFCARLYGKRRTKRKTERIIQELKNND